MDRLRSAVTTRRDATLPAPVVLALFAYGLTAASLAPFSRPIEVATALPMVVLVAIACTRGWHHRRLLATDRPEQPILVATVVAWVVLIAIVAGLAYAHYQSQPRTVYPTLSSLASTTFGEVPLSRAVAFGFWMWLGWYLVDR